MYHNLIQIRDFLTQKLFQSESIMRLYKNDLEYLKSELKSQTEVNEVLKETLGQKNEELEELKKNSITMKSKLDNITKKYDETVMFINLEYAFCKEE